MSVDWIHGYSRTAARVSPYFVEDVPLRGWKAALKVGLDRSLAAFALFFYLPLFAFIAIGLRVSLGPGVLFRRLTIGQEGRLFGMLYFRTVRPARDVSLKAEPGAQTPRWASQRFEVTPFSAAVNRLSLHTLPNFWNVLLGDVSLVGPRPRIPRDTTFNDEADFRVLMVRPGLTGLAQLVGRGSPAQERALEEWYIDNWSFRLDLQILWKTALAVFGRSTSTGPWTRDLT